MGLGLGLKLGSVLWDYGLGLRLGLAEFLMGKTVRWWWRGYGRNPPPKSSYWKHGYRSISTVVTSIRKTSQPHLGRNSCAIAEIAFFFVCVGAVALSVALGMKLSG